MKLQNFTLVAVVLAVLGLGACQQEEGVVKQEDISREILNQISRMGFGTTDVKKLEDGYLVEGDILLTAEQLSAVPDGKLLRIGEVEQYHTTNLVSAQNRAITVSISNSLPSAYVAALDLALTRYNAQNLTLTFKRVSSGANISITSSPPTANYLAKAGFPSKGKPYKSVVVNAAYLGSNPGTHYLATILAHELGHCIGFRHTDYMDRSYSCGGAVSNEGASTVGAIHIPGTPVYGDPNSWMLACIGDGVDRPFNANDETALNHLY